MEPSDKELDGAEPWMVGELTRYYQGRRRLADMMGVPADKFIDKDVEDALRYLLPSRLFARDARPSMKVGQCALIDYSGVTLVQTLATFCLKL